MLQLQDNAHGFVIFTDNDPPEYKNTHLDAGTKNSPKYVNCLIFDLISDVDPD